MFETRSVILNLREDDDPDTNFLDAFISPPLCDDFEPFWIYIRRPAYMSVDPDDLQVWRTYLTLQLKRVLSFREITSLIPDEDDSSLLKALVIFKEF